MNWVLFLSLQPCNTHEDKFRNKIWTWKKKGGHEQKKTMEKKDLGVNKFSWENGDGDGENNLCFLLLLECCNTHKVVVEIQAKIWATWNCKSSLWAFFVVNNGESPKIEVAY
jgi:hypothetical protein